MYKRCKHEISSKYFIDLGLNDDVEPDNISWYPFAISRLLSSFTNNLFWVRSSGV